MSPMAKSQVGIVGFKDQEGKTTAKSSHGYVDKHIVAIGCSHTDHISQPETEVRQIRMTQGSWSDES